MFLTYVSVLSSVVRLGSEQVIIMAQVPALVRYIQALNSVKVPVPVIAKEGK